MSGTDSALIGLFGPPTLENLEKNFAISHLTASFNYAGITIMLYDMLLTMQMEVRLLWRPKISFLKTAFLINRYVAPAFICVNIYFLSGRASGLTDAVRKFTPSLSPTYIFAAVCLNRVPRSTLMIFPSCRGWFSVAAVAQIFCLASVSFLFAFRLWAWYAVSLRVLYALLLVWAISLITALSLIVNLAGFHNHDIIHEPLLNICITIAPVIWPQWLPATIEHGIYAVFLLFNAMATPRSERKAALAIIYHDGILFYMLTFSVCLGALSIWAFAPRVYIGLGLYPPWIVFQVGISRLLLNVRTSQIFATRRQAVDDEDMFLEREMSLRDMISPQGRGVNRTSCNVVSHDSSNERRDEETGTESYFPSISKKNGHSKEWSQDGDHRDSVGREIRRIHSNAGSFRTRFWWLYRRSETADIHIDVMQTDNPGDSEWGESSIGGVKLSRLGRRDEWL